MKLKICTMSEGFLITTDDDDVFERSLGQRDLMSEKDNVRERKEKEEFAYS